MPRGKTIRVFSPFFLRCLRAARPQLAFSLPTVCLFLHGIKLDEFSMRKSYNPPSFLICAGCSEFPRGLGRNREIKLSVCREARWERFQRETKWRRGGGGGGRCGKATKKEIKKKKNGKNPVERSVLTNNRNVSSGPVAR